MPPLHTYFEFGKILIIGAALAEDGWNSVLTSEFCGTPRIRFQADGTQKVGDTTITHFSDVHTILPTEFSDELASFDVIVIGLQPDQKQAEEQFRLLTQRLMSLYESAEKKAVSSPLPQVVAFPTEKGLVLSRLLENEQEIRRFVHLLSDAEEALNFVDFQNTFVNALKEAVAFSLGLSFPRGIRILDKWLAQFEEPDRPLALRLLRHFRFYSAESQRLLLEEYLTYQKSVSGDGQSREVWLTYLGRANKSAPAVLTLAAKTSWARAMLEEHRPRALQVKSYENLISDLTTKAADLEKGPGLDIYLIDDVVGSGGQLTSYADKFLNKHLVGAFIKDHKEALWPNLINSVSHNYPNEFIRLHAVFVIGLESKEFEARLRDWSTFQVPNPRLADTRSLTGVISIPFRTTDKDSEVVLVRVRVHVIDYTTTVFGLCDADILPSSKVKSLLPRYIPITRPRLKEHWLQFEPFGWKECGGLVSTHLNCPGNTLPIIWGDAAERLWQPLFPRYFNPWDDGRQDAEHVLSTLDSDPEFQGDWTHPLTAYILRSLTSLSSEEIANRLGLSSSEIEGFIREVNNKLISDEAYRDKVRPIFVRLS